MAYNMIYVKFNEELGNKNNLYYDITYPSFYKFRNYTYNTSSNILNNLNTIIKSDVYKFRNSIISESVKNNNMYFKVVSDFSNTFSQNYLISSIVSVMAIDDTGLYINDLYSYNYDLSTGDKFFLEDIFIKGVDYLKIVGDYVNYKINKNKDYYNIDEVINISPNQDFYMSDDGIVIYINSKDLSLDSTQIFKFKMEFSKFLPYINPRFFSIRNTNNFKLK